MNPNKEMTVPFNGAELIVVQTPEGPYVPVKPVCAALGLDWSWQLKRLKGREKVIGMAEIAIPSAGGHQRTTCIPLHSVAFWLALVNPKTVAADKKADLERYQQECAAVLDRHVRKQEIALTEKGERLCWHVLAANPLWMKIFALHKAGVDRTMAFRHVRKSFEQTLAVIEEMEKSGVINALEWGDNSDDPASAVFADRTVRAAYMAGYRDPGGENRAPSRRWVWGEPVPMAKPA